MENRFIYCGCYLFGVRLLLKFVRFINGKIFDRFYLRVVLGVSELSFRSIDVWLSGEICVKFLL